MPSLALAKQARLFSGSFGEATSVPADPYPLQAAGAVAVDNSSHDVYVADPGNFRIERFDSTGHFLFMLGLEVNRTAVEESATRKAEENVCPSPGHPTDVCQAGKAGAGAGAFLEPSYLAVDNSVGPSKGDLYVGNTGELNEEQTIAVTATGGTFTLSFEGETTAPISFNAPPIIGDGPGSVEAALHALPKVGEAEVQLSPFSPGRYTITFVYRGSEELQGKNVPQMTCDASGLSGPGASCVAATKRQGLTANVVEKFDPSGQPIASWGEGGELTGAGITSPPAPVAGPFFRVHGIAVDPSGNLWVSAGKGGLSVDNKVFEFASDSSFVTSWAREDGELAVDASGNLYFDNGPVRKYTSVGAEIGVVAPSAVEFVEDNFTTGFEALDLSTDSLYLAGSEGFPAKPGTVHGVIKRYELATCNPVITLEPPEPGCSAVESFGAGVISTAAGHRIAVDPTTDALYVDDGGHVTSFSFLTVPDVTTDKPANPTANAATLTGVVNPSGIELNPGLEGCRFEWGETATYGHTVPCDKTAAQIGAGDAPIEVHAAISGLQAGRTYHYRLVVANANNVNATITEPSLGADVPFGPPQLESVSAIDVTATGATVQAQVNPNDLDTHLRVEYGAESGVYPQSTSASDAGALGTVQAAAIELVDLAPGVLYHYRVVAENVLGKGPEATVTSDHTFTTQPVSSFSLPDQRGWELVSPPVKHGALIKGPVGQELVQAAADGSAISYVASSPTEPDAAGNADKVQVVSARSAAGWSSLDIATPNVAIHGGGAPAEYRFFSSDLSLGIVEPLGAFAPEMSAEASEQAPYLRTDFPSGDPAAMCTTACYRPLVTGAPGFANVPPGTKFGREQLIDCGSFCKTEVVDFMGASRDAEHIVVTSTAPLIEGAPKDSLYEWTEGRLVLIDSLPGGAAVPPNLSVELGGERHQQTAISTDGTRVVWSDTTGNNVAHKQHLYLRDVPAEQTLQIDLNKGGSGKGTVEAGFQMASPDGSVVLFTDEQQLTPDSGAGAGHADLYRCQVITGESGELECVLTDLSPANGVESADVRGPLDSYGVHGGIVGASEDGSSVYFIANGVLSHNQVEHGAGPEEAQPGDCSSATSREVELAESCNLYLSREGTVTYITRVSYKDSTELALLGPARVSSNGQWLALMSERPLTGYDNRDRTTGKPAVEVYLFNAAAGPTGTLVCASCNPSGARPHGVEPRQLGEPRGINSQSTGSGRGLLAGFLLDSVELAGPIIAPYRPRTLSDSGRLFFDSTDGLVSRDSNGTEDVYQYEPSAVGSCTGSSSTFSPSASGCIDLISSGVSGQESAFLDASESGNDVFFITEAKLSPFDTDNAYDVYDARVEGGDREPEKPVECQGDACQGFVAAPSDATPDSLTFSGPGNLKPLALAAPPPTTKAKPKKCPKGKKLEHRKCAKTKKAKTKKAGRGGHRARKTVNTRGAK